MVAILKKNQFLNLNLKLRNRDRAKWTKFGDHRGCQGSQQNIFEHFKNFKKFAKFAKILNLHLS